MVMRRFHARRILVLAITTAALAGLVATAGLVAAQTATPTPGTSTTQPCASIGTKQGGMLDTLLTDLVNQGIINQSQADAIRNYLQQQAQGRCYRSLVLPKSDILSTAANKLGLTTSQLMAELRQGKSLAQVASEHGVSRDDLKNALLQTAQTNASALVQRGALTQDEADRALTDVQNSLDTLLDQTGLRGLKGGFGWGRGHHRWFGGPPLPNEQSGSQSGTAYLPGPGASWQ